MAEAADNFKNQGNEYFRARRYKEALGFYRQGLEAKPEDAQLKETLLLNAAACDLELSRYAVLTQKTMVVRCMRLAPFSP